MSNKSPYIFIIMGVSGCGKTTFGKIFAQKGQMNFLDGDDYHPEENIHKMTQGIALNDADRQGWLESLRDIIVNYHEEKPLAIGCSALKQSYRDIISPDGIAVEFIHLKGSYDLLHQRALKRAEITDHFMDPELLKSQFDTLEEPVGDNVLTLDVIYPIELNVLQALQHYFSNEE